jgi:hypothetical protein
MRERERKIKREKWRSQIECPFLSPMANRKSGPNYSVFMTIFFFSFTYPVRCLRVPQVEYHWSRRYGSPDVSQTYGSPRLLSGLALSSFPCYCSGFCKYCLYIYVLIVVIPSFLNPFTSFSSLLPLLIVLWHQIVSAA